MTKPPLIEVATCLLVEDGRIFLQQRPKEKKTAPFLWESPGGKYDDKLDRSLRDTAVREMEEELGLEVVVDEAPFHVYELTLPSGRHHFHFFDVLRFRPRPRPTEGQGIGWFTPGEILRLSLAPGNENALDVLWRALRRRTNGPMPDIGDERIRPRRHVFTDHSTWLVAADIWEAKKRFIEEVWGEDLSDSETIVQLADREDLAIWEEDVGPPSEACCLSWGRTDALTKTPNDHHPNCPVGHPTKRARDWADVSPNAVLGSTEW